MALTITMELEKELQLYESQKEALLKEGEGKYVVVKGDVLLKFFGTEEDALKEGYTKFGAKPFLVKKVVLIEPVCLFSPSSLHNAMFNVSSR